MNRRITVFDPWRISPRDLWDMDIDWGNSGQDVQVDMYEKGDDLVVEVKAPGIKKDSFDVKVEGGQITISGNSEEVTEEDRKDRKYYRKEIRQMSFSRTVDLPYPVDADNANAMFKDGMLRISLPKREEVKPKRLEVKSEE